MPASELRFEDLSGRTVRNEYGRVIGCIQDIRVEPDDGDYVVTEIVLGPVERWPRLKAFMGELPTLRALGLGKAPQLRPIPWQWVDLSDPERPRLRVGETKKVERAEKAEKAEKGRKGSRREGRKEEEAYVPTLPVCPALPVFPVLPITPE